MTSMERARAIGAEAAEHDANMEAVNSAKPLFRVTLHQDAFIHHVGLVRAASKADACEAALEQWNGTDMGIKFVEEDASGYDEAVCDSDDDVELIDVEDEAREEAYFTDATQPAERIAFSREELRLLVCIVGQHADDVREDNPQDAPPVQALHKKIKGVWDKTPHVEPPHGRMCEGAIAF